MHYVVKVQCVPDDDVELDRLQVVGAAALLSDGLDVFAEHGVVVEPPPAPGADPDSDEERVGYLVMQCGLSIDAGPDGLVARIGVHAPTIEMAEGACQAACIHVLGNDTAFDGWGITGCQVELDDQAALALLHGAGGPGAPPDDLTERAAMLAAPGDDPQDKARGILVDAAKGMRAFPLSMFAAPGTLTGNDAETEKAVLACGAVMSAASTLLSGLFDDLLLVQTSQEEHAGSVPREELDALAFLPAGYMNEYSEQFVRRLVVSTGIVTARLNADEPWAAPASIAESLAFEMVIREADWILRSSGLEGPADWESHLRGHGGNELVWESLFADLPSEVAAMGLHPGLPTWFAPFDDRTCPVFTTDVDRSDPNSGHWPGEDDMPEVDWDEAAARLLDEPSDEKDT